MTASRNPLVECGMPLFFRVREPGDLALRPPARRLEDALRVAVRSLSLMQKEALVASARTKTDLRVRVRVQGFAGDVPVAVA
jgi:hypothetical protein